MGQHTCLHRRTKAQPKLVEHLQQSHCVGYAVVGGIDADDRVSAAIHQAIQHGGKDALQVVGRMIGLQAHGHPAPESERVAEARDDVALLCGQDQVLVAHQL